MSTRRKLVRAANSAVSLVLFLALLLCGAYAVYALWDNRQLYESASDVQLKLMAFRPDPDDPEGPSFEELLKINPDVCAWVTMDGTAIDFPVLQGETNLTYINKDAYGEFALAGSIFLDSRNAFAFTDTYSLLYGHHMANSRMFGDLDEYKKPKFFDTNTTGILMTPQQVYDLEVFAVLIVDASEDHIFDVHETNAHPEEMLSYVKEEALFCREPNTADGQIKVLALTTCDPDETEARTIVLTTMTPRDTGREV